MCNRSAGSFRKRRTPRGVEAQLAEVNLQRLLQRSGLNLMDTIALTVRGAIGESRPVRAAV